jgi:hypothetical protein
MASSERCPNTYNNKEPCPCHKLEHEYSHLCDSRICLDNNREPMHKECIITPNFIVDLPL